MSDGTPEMNQRFETLLLKEYDHLSASFRGNEELGERRVNIYLAIVSAVVAVMGYLILRPPDGSRVSFHPVVVLALLALLAFGILTLVRVVRRNIATDECLEGLRLVRSYFVARGNEEHLQCLTFNPYNGRRVRKQGSTWTFGKAGMVETVALLNSIVSWALVSTFCSWANSALSDPLAEYGDWFTLALGLGAALVAWALQMAYARKSYRREAARHR
jgi:hypothetical protein